MAPSFLQLRTYSDRTRRVPCALFPGYIFVAVEPERLLSLIATDGVQYVLRSGRSLGTLSQDEVSSIHALCNMDATQSATCQPAPLLRLGQRVRIEAGPLAGLEGNLVRVRDVNRIVVTIESLQSSISVEVGQSELRVVEGPETSAETILSLL